MKQPTPPRAAIAQLKRRGYAVKEWNLVVPTDAVTWSDDGERFYVEECSLYDCQWVGYSTTKPAICTVSMVTGKVLVEACERADFAEILDE